METTFLDSLHKLKVPMSTKTSHFLCKITNFLKKKLLFRPWNLINLGIYSSSKPYTNPLIIHISRLLTWNTLLPIQMVSNYLNYLMNFYLFEDIFTKLQRTLIKICKQGIFIFLYNILLMESFFLPSEYNDIFGIMPEFKYISFFKNLSNHYTKVSQKTKIVS